MILLKTTKGNVFHTFSAKNIRRSTGWLVKGPKERLPVKKHAVAELHTTCLSGVVVIHTKAGAAKLKHLLKKQIGCERLVGCEIKIIFLQETYIQTTYNKYGYNSLMHMNWMAL